MNNDQQYPRESFRSFLKDVLETTVIKDNLIEEKGPRTWSTLEMILEACVWRYTGEEGRPLMQDAELILKQEYPIVFEEYKKYKDGLNA